jgi:hypothetical protein
MGAFADVKTQVTVTTDQGHAVTYPPTETRFALGAAGDGTRQAVSLAGSSTFTALTVPSGAKGIRILLPLTAASMTLKGATGDATGIVIVFRFPVHQSAS